MKPTFLKKHTAGGTAGISWEAGEVKEVNSRLADELTALAPEDFEIVEAVEPEPVETPESDGPAADEDNVVEPVTEEPVKTPRAAKPKGVTKKSVKTTETPSAE